MREDQSSSGFEIGSDAASDFHVQDMELLRHLLSFCLPKRSAKSMARLLLNDLKSLPRVVSASTSTLDRLGVPPRAVEILTVFRESMAASLRRSFANTTELPNWTALIDYLHVTIANREREQFRVIFLDSRNGLVADEKFSEGTVNQTSVYVREIVKRALDLHATAIILVHNHPAGDPKPSREDIQLTNHIRDATRLLGIALHDHIVVGSSGHASFKALGLL